MPSSFCCSRSRSLLELVLLLLEVLHHRADLGRLLVYCCICGLAFASASSIVLLLLLQLVDVRVCGVAVGTPDSRAWSYSYQASSSLLFTMRSCEIVLVDVHLGRRFARPAASCELAAVSPLAMLACAAASALLTS